MDEQGISEAYSYLINKKSVIQTVSSQYYNFLYCLAAMDNKNDEALAWLEEAIIDKELWYRSEVFEGEDLDGIRDLERFKKCFEISERKYKIALEQTKTLFTWKEKERNKLVVALHGNQQNLNDSKEKWDFLRKKEYQVEYIQSSEIDSIHIFRWENEGTGPKQLTDAVKQTPWNDYDKKILCGFSSGCNVILRSILHYDLNCSTIILQSPWIPMIENELEDVVQKLEELKINVFVICGKKDDDCFSLSQTFYERATERNVRINKLWIDDLDHDFSDNHESIVLNYLKGLRSEG